MSGFPPLPCVRGEQHGGIGHHFVQNIELQQAAAMLAVLAAVGKGGWEGG